MVVESTLVNKARRGDIGSRRSLEAGEGGDSEVRKPCSQLWSRYYGQGGRRYM